MAWYKTGTGTFTNGSPAVTGSGTAWVANAAAGQGIVGPDGRTYEVLSVNSDTSLTLSTNYLGSTASGAAYLLVPTQDYVRGLAAQVATLINDYSTVKNNAGAGKFGDGTLSQPGVSFSADTDLGIRRYGVNQASLVAGGGDQLIWAATGIGLGVVPTYQLTVAGLGQDTAALTDAGNKQGSIYIRASGGGAGTGGALLLGTNYGTGVPLAAVKGYLNDGSGNTAGRLVFSVRRSIADTALTQVGTFAQDGRMILDFGMDGLLIRGTAGAPAPSLTDGGVCLQATTSSAALLFSDPTRTANNRRFVMNWNSGQFGMGFHNDGISAYANGLTIVGGQASGVSAVQVGGPLLPVGDNTLTLGSASFRWSTVYAGTGSINTSDARLKTAVRPLDAAEVSAAVEISDEIGVFQYLASVDEKGQDGARLHAGLTVQRVIEIMESHGLDPMRYAFICHDSWEEYTVPARTRIEPAVTKTIPAVIVLHPASQLVNTHGVPLSPERMEMIEPEREEVVTPEQVIVLEPERVMPAGDVYSFRPDELALFIARGIAAKQNELEARIAALEAA